MRSSSPPVIALHRFCLIACLALIGLSACADSAGPAAQPSALPSPLATVTSRPTITAAPTFTPTATQEPATPTPAPSPTLTATPAPECQENWCVAPGHLWLQRPVSGVLGDWIDPSYRYGETQNGTREEHSGVEFPAEYGQPVFAAADGRVVVAGSDEQVSYSERAGFYGNLVIIEHTFAGFKEPVYSLYAHLSAVDATVGANVVAGQQVGAVGATGWANGPHLHFEVRVGENSFDQIRNPELWLTPHFQPDGSLNGAFAGHVVSADGYSLEIESVELRQLTGEQRAYYMRLYTGKIAQPDDAWQETTAQGDLPPGDYQWSFIARGKVWKGVIPIRAGQTTVIEVAVQ